MQTQLRPPLLSLGPGGTPAVSAQPAVPPPPRPRHALSRSQDSIPGDDLPSPGRLSQRPGVDGEAKTPPHLTLEATAEAIIEEGTAAPNQTR